MFVSVCLCLRLCLCLLICIIMSSDYRENAVLLVRGESEAYVNP